MTGCCAPPRSRSTRKSRARCSSGIAEVIARKIADLGLRLKEGRDFDLTSFEDAKMLERAGERYYALGKRRGLTRDYAAAEMRRNGTLIAAMLVHDGQADGMLCGTFGPYTSHLKYVREVIGQRDGVENLAAMHLLMLPRQTVFICDTYINEDPTATELADMAVLAAETVRRFGLDPRVALLSHSNFGTADTTVGAQDARGGRADP